MHRLTEGVKKTIERGQRSYGVQRERGIALIMVLGLLALVGSVVTDFQFSSRVDLQLAYNARDELQAEYNALSALRMRALILKQSRKLQQSLGSLMSMMGGGAAGGAGAAGAAGGASVAGGAGGAAQSISAVLEMIPVECGLMSAITKKVDKGFGKNENEKEDFFPGECMATSESEHSKIAINLIANSLNNRNVLVQGMLLGLLSDARMRHFFEHDDRNGQHAETPLALLGNIVDYVDTDRNQQGNFSDEDRLYQIGKDPYRVKNAPFDSVAELQLVYGVSDALYNLLKDRVSVYTSDPAIELSTAPIETIVLFGLPGVLRPGVTLDTIMPALAQLAPRLSVIKQMGPGFMPLTTGLLKSMMDQAGLSNAYDPQKLDQVFTDRSSTTWYTILAQGQMNRASRRIRAVFQATEGSFYYVRVE